MGYEEVKLIVIWQVSFLVISFHSAEMFYADDQVMQHTAYNITGLARLKKKRNMGMDVL